MAARCKVWVNFTLDPLVGTPVHHCVARIASDSGDLRQGTQETRDTIRADTEGLG